MDPNISPQYFQNKIALLNTAGHALVSEGDVQIKQHLEAGQTSIVSTLNSTSAESGSLLVSGGVGISKDLYLGGNANILGNSNVSGNLNVTEGTTVSGVLAATNASGSTDTSSGALLVSGGAGIVENLNVGGNITTQSGRPVLPASFGDIQETSTTFVSGSTNADIAGFIFPTASVASFSAQVSIKANVGAENLSAQYDLQGVQTKNGWSINQKAIGDVVDLKVKFQVNSQGQIAYTSDSLAGFVSGSIKYKASTTTVDGVYTANTSGSTAVNYSPLAIGSNAYQVCTPLPGGSIGNLGMSLGHKRIYFGNADQADPALPLDRDANHGGLVLQGHKDHYFIYDMETESWLMSDNLALDCDNFISICDNKVLDANKLKIGSRLHQGEIYMGSGEHNTWRIKSNETSGELEFQYRKLDGLWVTKQTVALATEDKAGMDTNMYIEKRGEALKMPTTYTSSGGVLSHDVRLTSDDVVVAGRIIKKSVNFEGTWPGPLFKVKPGDTLNLKFKNDIDDFGDLADWNIGPNTEYRKHLHAHIDEDTQTVNWMSHSMPRGITNLHFHGVHYTSQGLGDNVLRMSKPGSALQYSYEIPANHPGGLYFYHPHSHGESMNMIGRGAAGLIFIEGPYQERVDAANVKRQIMSFNRLNWKHEGAHDIASWYDYTAALPTDIYKTDTNGLPVALDTFVPEDFQGAYKFNTDVGRPGACGCGAGTTSRCAVNGCRNSEGLLPAPCATTDIAWVPLINGQVQPVISVQPGELQVWDYINTSTITFSRISVEGHDIILVGKDGVPRNIENVDLSAAPLDSDFVNHPPGVRLNYLINTSAQRFEFFVVPKVGITPIAGDIYNVLLQTIDQTELMFNDTEAQTPAAHDYLGNPIAAAGGALEADIVIAKFAYSGSALANSASNHVSKLASLLPSVVADAAAIPQDDFKQYSYLFAQDYPTYAADWKKDLTVTAVADNGSGKMQVTFDSSVAPRIKIDDRLIADGAAPPQVTLSGFAHAGHNGTFDLLNQVDKFTYVIDANFVATDAGTCTYSFYTMETQTLAATVAGTTNPTVTCVEPHKLVAGNPVTINSGLYSVNAVVDAYAFTLETANDLTGATNISYETINLEADHFAHYNMSQNMSIFANKVTRRRKIWFAFNTQPSEAGLSTWMDGGAYDEKYRIQTHINTTEEFLMQNYTEVIHTFHIHVNNYQVCAYRDANFGYNVNGGDGYVDKLGNTHTVNPVSTYSNEYLEKDIPFYGYEDTTNIPVAQGDPNATASGVVDGLLGHRGEVRIRYNSEPDQLGIFYMHCHLLDDQDMGMMKLVEICGPGYTPAPEPSELPAAGLLTDYNNVPI